MKTLWCLCVLALLACLLHEGQVPVVGFETTLDQETSATLEGAAAALDKCDSSDHRSVECEAVNDRYTCRQSYQKSESIQELLDELSWGEITTCTRNGCKNVKDRVYKVSNCLSQRVR